MRLVLVGRPVVDVPGRREPCRKAFTASMARSLRGDGSEGEGRRRAITGLGCCNNGRRECMAKAEPVSISMEEVEGRDVEGSAIWGGPTGDPSMLSQPGGRESPCSALVSIVMASMT